MTTALHRRLSALQNLTVDRGATPGEAAAAIAAIDRIRTRLRLAGEALESPVDTEPERSYPAQNTPQRRRARRKAAHEWPRAARLKVGDIIDAWNAPGSTWGPCQKCHGMVFQVCHGIDGIAKALLVCLKCRTSRKLRPYHFATPEGRWME